MKTREERRVLDVAAGWYSGAGMLGAATDRVDPPRSTGRAATPPTATIALAPTGAPHA